MRTKSWYLKPRYVNVFVGLFAGYCTYTIARRAVVVVSRDLQAKHNLDNSNLGAINSSFSIAYGISKFFAGVATDFVSPSVLFAGGLFFAGFTNVVFPMFSSLYGFCFLWFINGLAQGCGWPSLSKIMLEAFPTSIRGSIWGLLTMGGNVGQSISPLLLSYLYYQYGWQYAFFTPGIWAVGFAFVSYFLIGNKGAGITTDPSIKKIGKGNDDNLAMGKGTVSYNTKTSKKMQNEKEIISTKNTFQRQVLSNKYFWILILADILIYFILKALSDWSIKLLKEDRAFTPMIASTCLSAYETGGVAGTLLTGIISDNLGGRRNLTSFLYSLVLFPSLLALYILDDASSVTISIVLFFLGFGVYGPKTMCGLAVREMCDKQYAGTAGGLLGLAGQIGAAAAGYPLGLAADKYGWNSFNIILIASSATIIFLFGILQNDYERIGNGNILLKKKEL